MTLMETTYTPLPAELRPLLSARGDEPLYLRDGETQKVYLLIEHAPAPEVDDVHLRKLLAEADDDIAQGDVSEWNVDEIKADARRRFAERRLKHD
jgi:hypothetical protein